MHSEVPKPPTKKLLFLASISGGITIGIWAVTGVGHLVFSGIPAPRLVLYATAGLIGIAVTGWLGTRYVVQKHRRDAWWDGFAASDEPLAEVIELRDVKGYEGSKRKFVSGSPS